MRNATGSSTVWSLAHSCVPSVASGKAERIPVHHHPTKAETFVILKGKVRVSTYNNDGEVLESCVISQENGTYGVDIPKNVWHGLECLEPSVLLECKEGPFVEHEVDGILEKKK